MGSDEGLGAVPPGVHMNKPAPIIAQVLSASAVVVGLVFVGYELRQNTAMMRGATMQAISDKYVDYVIALADSIPADLMRRVHSGETTDDFTPVENTQISIMFNAFVQMLENSFLQHREGLVSEAVFDSYGWTWGMIQTARFEEYWRNRSSPHVASPEFVGFFEARVQIGPDKP
jgi:hypothetical protein